MGARNAVRLQTLTYLARGCQALRLRLKVVGSKAAASVRIGKRAGR